MVSRPLCDAKAALLNPFGITRITKVLIELNLCPPLLLALPQQALVSAHHPPYSNTYFLHPSSTWPTPSAGFRNTYITKKDFAKASCLVRSLLQTKDEPAKKSFRRKGQFMQVMSPIKLKKPTLRMGLYTPAATAPVVSHHPSTHPVVAPLPPVGFASPADGQTIVTAKLELKALYKGIH